MPEKLRTRWDDFKVGQRVRDAWYLDIPPGEVTYIGRVRSRHKMHVRFQGTWGLVVYDRPHATRFLEIVPRKRKAKVKRGGSRKAR